MSDHYILLDDGVTVVPCDDLKTWAQWLNRSDAVRQIAADLLPSGVHVSTVFLGLDYSFGMPHPVTGDSRPILWETMIFGGRADGFQRRYWTR